MTLTNLALVDQGKSLSSAVKGKASMIDYAHIIKLAYPSQENLITEEMPRQSHLCQLPPAPQSTPILVPNPMKEKCLIHEQDMNIR